MRRRLYRSLYDAPNFAAKVASIASMTKICEPALAAPPADRCCASQDAVLDGAVVLADAFELVRFSNPAAEGVGLSLSTLLDAIEKVAAGGDPADRESQPELAWAGWRCARERPAAPARHRLMRTAPACRGRAPACCDAPSSPAAARSRACTARTASTGAAQWQYMLGTLQLDALYQLRRMAELVRPGKELDSQKCQVRHACAHLRASSRCLRNEPACSAGPAGARQRANTQRVAEWPAVEYQRAPAKRTAVCWAR